MLLGQRESLRRRRGGRKASNQRLGIKVYDTFELQEWNRCASDPVHFIKSYVRILHPVRGRIPFDLWPFQEGTITDFLKSAFTICLKPRQMGLSWLVAAFITWVAIFMTDKNVLVVSIKLGAAIRFLDKIKYIIEGLPEFLQPDIVESSKMVITLDNGSRIESIPTSEEAGRSEGVSLMVFDEAAFIRWMDRIWAAAFPTLSTGGMCIALSTANGVGNWFHDKWQSASSGASAFRTIKLNWQMHPERGEDWYNSMLAELGKLRFAQEVLCDFITSGNPYFDPVVLRGIEESDIQQPTVIDMDIDVGGRVGIVTLPVRTWREPLPGEEFVLSLDPCKGDGTSRLGLHVFSLDDGAQVAACSEMVPDDVSAALAAELGFAYNTASVAVEDNKGMVVLSKMMDTHDYPDVYHMEKIIRKDGKRYQKGEPGFNMNNKTRPYILSNFEVATRQDTVTIRDIVTLNQMWNFCYADGTMRPEARTGYCDDLVISGSIAYEVMSQYGFGSHRQSVSQVGGPLGDTFQKMSEMLPDDHREQMAAFAAQHKSHQHFTESRNGVLPI